MRVIYSDTVQSIALTTGTADTEYPLTNLRDGHPRKPFRTSGGNTCTITVQESGLASALALVMTNCTDITVTPVLSVVYSWGMDSTESVLTGGEDSAGSAIGWVDDSSAEDFMALLSNYDGESGTLFVTFGSIGIPRTITLQCNAANSSFVSIGLLVAGQSLYLRDFESRSYQATSEDKGTEVELNDGSTWYKQTRVLRRPSGSIVMYAKAGNADPAGYNSFDEFMSKVWLTQGKTPMVWQLSKSGLESDMFAGIAQEPSAVMHGREYKLVSISLKERI